MSERERERVRERKRRETLTSATTILYTIRRRRRRVSTTRATDGQRACVFVCVCACVSPCNVRDRVCVSVCGSWPGPVRARAFRSLIGWLRHRSPRYIRMLTMSGCVCAVCECASVSRECSRACVRVWYPCTFGLTTNCPGRHFPHKTTPKH